MFWPIKVSCHNRLEINDGETALSFDTSERDPYAACVDNTCEGNGQKRKIKL
jgi:hypothetical protein